MSLICLCVVENVRNNSEIVFFTQQMETLAKRHGRGISFFVNWSEPLITRVKKDSLIISISDCPESDNCELFLLPDGWYCNGQTNRLAFRERMKFLQDISGIFLNREYSVDFYIGLSGTDPEDFSDVTIKNDDLADYLAKTVGVNGLDFDGLHISVFA